MYEIEYESERIDWDYEIPIKDEVLNNEAVGDKIGIDKNNNVLWFSEFIDIENEDINDFLKTYFKDYKSVKGFIRRLIS